MRDTHSDILFSLVLGCLPHNLKFPGSDGDTTHLISPIGISPIRLHTSRKRLNTSFAGPAILTTTVRSVFILAPPSSVGL